VSWPVTQFLLQLSDWRTTYLVFAAVLVCVCAPLHALALPRIRADLRLVVAAGKPPVQVLPAKGLPFILVAAGFAVYAFVPSGLAAHLLAIFGRAGVDPATAVAIGAMFGPAQVAARLCELFFGRGLHPLTIARIALGLMLAAFAMLAMLGLSIPVAAAFAIMFGAANGLITIARGAVPLALFGPSGYGRVLGRIAKPFQITQALAPLALAVVVERASDAAALALTAGCTCVALICMLALRPPRAGTQ
jgi:predicted MFS family arabinose efflux permease